jgi:hypothetical protein
LQALLADGGSLAGQALSALGGATFYLRQVPPEGQQESISSKNKRLLSLTHAGVALLDGSCSSASALDPAAQQLHRAFVKGKTAGGGALKCTMTDGRLF